MGYSDEPIGVSKNIAVVGGGWLGRKIARALSCSIAYGIDIAVPKMVAHFLDEFEPQIIINGAGRAGPPSHLQGVPGVPQNIDWCNLNDETRAMTRRSNIEGPGVLGRLCRERGIQVVHISSGCLWNGPSIHSDRAWREMDQPKPVSFYSETKVEGEQVLIEACGVQEPLIPRIRLPIDGLPNPRNLITKLAKYPEIMDVFNSVTVVDSFLFALDKLIRDDRTGIYHVTNPGAVFNAEIIWWYCELVDPTHRECYEVVSEQEIFKRGRATEGRSNCLLNTKKLEEAGIFLGQAEPEVKKALLRYKQELSGAS